MRSFLLEELADALDDRSGQFRYFFVLSSGRIEPYAADDPAAALLSGRSDAILISPLSHAEARHMTSDFIETLAYGKLAGLLEEALAGSAGSGRFLQVIGAYPRARRSWLSYRQRRLHALALEWLTRNGVDLNRFGLDLPARTQEEATGLRFDARLEPMLEASTERAAALAKKVRRLDASGADALAVAKRALRFDEIFHSNAIRGNRLTRDQSETVVRRGLAVGGLTLREHLEAVNLNKALDHAELLAQSEAPLSEHALRELHAKLYAGIDDEIAGLYRRTDARLVGRDYLPPESVLVPALIRECTEWLEESAAHPVAKAVAAQAKVLNIAPFADGNGRVGRLLTNLLLAGAGYPPAVVRAEDRARYYDALHQVDEGDMSGLLQLTIERIQDGMQHIETALANVA